MLACKKIVKINPATVLVVGFLIQSLYLLLFYRECLILLKNALKRLKQWVL